MRTLVTGCGGFLGQAIARQLLASGEQVVGLVRRPVDSLQQMGVELRFGDVRNRDEVIAAAKGVDAIIHTAAIAGVWGRWKDYYETNTLGTLHCLAACRVHDIPVLVYCSSPSVTFDGRDQSGIDESVGYPKRWLAHYPHTKALGEKAVLAAHADNVLHTAAIRPHLIWGVNDPHLLPRLVERAREGRLAIVGKGTNRIDTVHVENAAAAHVLALNQLRQSPRAGGRSYFVTQDEPVNCWEWIGELLSVAKVPPPRRRVPLHVAYAAGAMLEAAYAMMRRKAEPPMTRFVALQLARDHWFRLDAAKELLGYRPVMSTAAGLEQLRASDYAQGL